MCFGEIACKYMKYDYIYWQVDGLLWLFNFIGCYSNSTIF